MVEEVSTEPLKSRRRDLVGMYDPVSAEIHSLLLKYGVVQPSDSRAVQAKALASLLEKNALNEWAITCWSGKKVDDYHRRLVEMLRTRDWALRELAAVEKILEPYHPIDKRSASVSLQLLLDSPPQLMQGIKQITDLMNTYSERAGEKAKQRKLPFFARVSLFIKKALGLRMDIPEVRPPLRFEPVPARQSEAPLTKEERYARLAEGWVDAAILDPLPLEFDFSGEDVGKDMSNEELREWRKRLGA